MWKCYNILNHVTQERRNPITSCHISLDFIIGKNKKVYYELWRKKHELIIIIIKINVIF